MGILIEADHVSRDYESGAGFMRAARRHRAVDDVCMHVDDDVVAVVGESGCGKSTLAHMLLGLLPPTSGQVRLDGRPIETMGRKEIARLVQPVFQDPYSSLNPSATIMSTLLLPLIIHKIGNQKERKENVAEIMDAVGLAQRHAESYPSQLSGGQRQRVAIARAILADPRILILDEATSSLDSESEAAIQAGLAELMKGRTTFVIAHRLSTIRKADAILVVEGGRIIEHGRHEELLALGGRYADLYTRQYGVEANLFLNPGESPQAPGELPTASAAADAGAVGRLPLVGGGPAE